MSAETWATVEEFEYRRQPNQTPIHFKLERPDLKHIVGDFTRVRIVVKNHADFVLNNDDGWVEYNSKEQPSDVYALLHKRSLVHSKYVLVLPSSHENNDPPLLLLRSWGYASDAGRLHVIGFQPSGKPILLLNTNLDLIELADLDGDGRLEIVGRPCMSQMFGNNLKTYDPIHVYKVPVPVTSPAKFSLALSKAYNLKHYYGWAGPDCSEKLAIVLRPPSGGKPLIMPEDKARRLMSQESEKAK
jgi:hypothetical protein